MVARESIILAAREVVVLVLVVAFSVGLATTLTLVGLAFLYARNRFRGPAASSRWPRLLPIWATWH